MFDQQLKKLSGVVVIGRNEGERLRCCLSSVINQAELVVYVDSGSTDGSVAMASEMGVIVEELDLTIPFTAARARNAGFLRLLALRPDLDFVQFVDGDCEVVANWLPDAQTFLEEHSDTAVVCGRRRERYPQRSVYNQLCDTEWDTPIGQAKACGGDAMMRVSAFQQVSGFRPDLIAGEEPELCVRLRRAGWQVWRLDAEMTMHDAAMTRFGQWWMRAVRGGHAYAEGASLHGTSAERHWVKETRRNWFWGLILPVLTFLSAISVGVWGWLLLLLYPLQVFRIAIRGNLFKKESWARAFFLVLGKFPEMIGQMKFISRSWTGKNSRLIEYK